MSTMPKNKRIHLEVLRILAILLVIFNHTGKLGFFLFAQSNGVQYWIYLFISIACKVAVPIFFMISGALLLSRQEDFKTLFKKRILKMLLVLFLFSLLTYVVRLYTNGGEFDISYFFLTLFSKKFASAYWYLYAYLGLLLMLPILRKLVTVLRKEDYKYLIYVHLGIGVVAVLTYFLWEEAAQFNVYFEPLLMTNVPIFYFIIGYYFENMLKINEIKSKQIYQLLGVSVVAILISCLMTDYRTNVLGYASEAVSQKFHSTFTVIPVIAMFITTKWIITCKIHLSSMMQRIIIFGGSITFGVMLLEELCRSFLHKYFVSMIGTIPTMLVAFLWTFATFILAGAITAIWKKIQNLFKYKLINVTIYHLS